MSQADDQEIYPLFEEEKSADVVIARFDKCDNPRLVEVMSSIVRHAHAVVKETEPTVDEWMKAIEFLTWTGHMSDDWRQEFILLSDTLGISMLVETINNRTGGDVTEATVLGPFHIKNAPVMDPGGNICRDGKGEPLVVSGRVFDENGKPVPNCLLDVWTANAEGFYDVQQKGIQPDMNLRGIFKTDENGYYWFRGIKPRYYPIPEDGPVGQMLKAMNRHANRPAHIHFILEADGYNRLTTHIFIPGDKYLTSDAVFGVKESLVADIKRIDDAARAKELGFDNPFWQIEQDFVLKRRTK